ncbi:metalloprotease MEP1 [Colletotrichum tofieldiae]|nr:metalloprotease MEP1 [Colletotrichum tofieldiae]GKT67739.1 metalloprotease MEP1 [Colletotrichum tofieldiae]
MRFSQFLSILLPVFVITTNTSLSNGQVNTLPRCGTQAADKGFGKALERVKAYENAIRLRTREDVDSGQRGSLHSLDVTVHFHTVSSTEKVGAITDDALKAQFGVLRKTYADYDINLHWNGIVASQTVDDWLAKFTWPITSDRVAQKRDFLSSTRLGGYDELNFYFYTDMAVGAWGSCNVAKENVTVNFDDIVFREDGCNINYLSLPGGPHPVVNLGYTVVHEAGHWFGLQHVFSTFACDDVGDTIDDTPATSEPTTGCPIRKDSCQDMPGLDPIHNFMDYSDDAWSDLFCL